MHPLIKEMSTDPLCSCLEMEICLVNKIILLHAAALNYESFVVPDLADKRRSGWERCR